MSNSDAGGSGSTTNTTLVSPSFSLVGYSSATLSFWHHYDWISDDNANVEVSTNGGGSWTNLITYAGDVGTPTAFTNEALNLTPYVGQANVQVRFRYFATWDWYWAIDNVTVTGNQPATFSWASSPLGFTSNVQNPTGVVVNASTTYTVTASSPNGCVASASVPVTANPLPVVTCGAYGPYCMNDADVTLTPTPSGGTWTGTGVTSGGIFDPSAGTQTLTYSYTDGNGCSSTCQVTITVFTTDTDGDGLPDCDDDCPNLFGEVGALCDAGPGFVLGTVVGPPGSCTCVGTVCTTNLSLSFQTDGVSNVGWEVRTQGSNIVVHSDAGVYPQSPGYGLNFCLPDGCYYLVVTDNAGDGFTSGGVQGGYILKTLDNGAGRLIDNKNNFLSGFTSQIAGGEGFCIPMGADRLIYTSCDRLDWRNNEYIVANDNPVVNAEYGVTNATSGYQMWWYNPNGGYSFRRTQFHNTGNGLPASNTRACHFKINAWSGNQLVQGTLYNVKVRG
ncbi:MAG TPA: hypothetical protein PK760_11355, partial [Flavobacteriales bacterium]|nr:hypothetical protein [Flavobacteriales bacterium]